MISLKDRTDFRCSFTREVFQVPATKAAVMQPCDYKWFSLKLWSSAK